MGTKGARLTTEISLPGRFLVYTPFGEGIGISRRLEDDERERLKGISKQLDLPEGGIIIRTAAEGASKEELEGDLALLQKLWSTLKSRAARTAAPALVYQEAELPLRIVRDLFIRDFERVVVDHEQTYRRIVGYLKRTSGDLADRVELLRRQGAPAREVRRRRGGQVHARAAGRPPVRRLPDLRLRRGVHGRGRQHRPVRRRARQVERRAARGHDHEEQPRGRLRGRAPAPPPRHRRDHRHRLHRHGEPEEPRTRRGGAEERAGAGPDEDLRRRDLAARPRRDDAAERDRRAARDPHARAAPSARATASSSPTRRTRSRPSGSCAASCSSRATRRSRSSCPRRSRAS